jgi:ABC-2 type transport system permease protein
VIKVYESISEELKKLKTDRMILIIALVMPILINLIVGWELSNGVISRIPIAVVDQDGSQLSRQIAQYFADNESFDLKYYVESQQALQQLLDTSQIKAGIVIPKNFSQDVVSLRSPTVLMLYDGSHMSITSVAKAKASEILLTLRTGASIKQLEARLNMNEEEAYHTAMPISFETRALYNPAKNFSYFMTPGYGTIICQTGIGLTAVLCIKSRKIKDKKRNILGYILGKTIFYAGLGSMALVTNILVQIYGFKIPFRGSLGMAIILSILVALAVAALSVAVSAWVPNRVVAIVIVGLLLIPNSVMAGYTWPLISMVPFYQKTAYLIPFYHYGDNIRNLFLKGSLQNAGADICFLIVFTISMVSFTMIRYLISSEILIKKGAKHELTL